MPVAEAEDAIPAQAVEVLPTVLVEHVTPFRPHLHPKAGEVHEAGEAGVDVLSVAAESLGVEGLGVHAASLGEPAGGTGSIWWSRRGASPSCSGTWQEVGRRVRQTCRAPWAAISQPRARP